MNILILDTNTVEKELVELCLKSKHLTKVYTASKEPLKNISNIEYTDYDDLCKKAKTLKIDIVLFANKNSFETSLQSYPNSLTHFCKAYA